ncbi:grasp-with-spasm system ATP-grasp peptide maturase [Aquimarina algiphila]|uniref:grasp-with-spasm system ATP-grasp peptide maturase n=1 Tax=Aquimarina algiphila TaxID=2047982 RepID=UPI00232CFFF9|nr:grasp-with-spasm system ATP-grasp peptide maturase [Aquimarina algiphila]
MILICKNYKENNDSYEEVIDWLLYKNARFDFLSGEDYYENGKDWRITLNNSRDELSIPFGEYKSVWFRGFLRHRNHLEEAFNDLESTNDNIAELRWRIGQEIGRINNQIFNNFQNAYQLPSPLSVKSDKFSMLRLAKELGLDIPDSLITNSKKELLQFFKKQQQIITKPLYETVYFNDKSYVAFFKTNTITEEVIKSLPETFFPSLFQGYVEKDIELRAFYIEEKFYTMAIFSQLDPQTKIDFRNYNDEKPNRNVPYLLPEEIEIKIKRLMKELNLNTGSIDLIKTPDKKYVFLEVNPTGQFGFVSKPCNYYLEDVIAEELIRHDN